MQVEFSFDDQKMVKKGVRKEDIYYTLKKNFAERGLECTADGKILTFASTGKNEDYGNIWAIIFALIGLQTRLRAACLLKMAKKKIFFLKYQEQSTLWLQHKCKE